MGTGVSLLESLLSGNNPSWYSSGKNASSGATDVTAAGAARTHAQLAHFANIEATRTAIRACGGVGLTMVDTIWGKYWTVDVGCESTILLWNNRFLILQHSFHAHAIKGRERVFFLVRLPTALPEWSCCMFFSF